MSKLDASSLHKAFLQSLGDLVEAHSEIARKPLEITARYPLPKLTRVYLYNLTNPPGGRTVGEYKIQIIVPGQARGTRGHFDHSAGFTVLLAGYDSEMEVFVFWDSVMYPTFAYSVNVQVKPETVCAAYSGCVSTQKRNIRGVGWETLVACRAEQVVEAIQVRSRLTLERLVSLG